MKDKKSRKEALTEMCKTSYNQVESSIRLYATIEVLRILEAREEW